MQRSVLNHRCGWNVTAKRNMLWEFFIIELLDESLQPYTHTHIYFLLLFFKLLLCVCKQSFICYVCFCACFLFFESKFWFWQNSWHNWLYKHPHMIVPNTCSFLTITELIKDLNKSEFQVKGGHSESERISKYSNLNRLPIFMCGIRLQ